MEDEKLMIDNFFEYLLKGQLDNKDPFDFSIELEEYLVENYEAMYLENPYLTNLANEEIPDITETMEPGMDAINFYRQLDVVYQKLRVLR
jgi:hypothetical protein